MISEEVVEQAALGWFEALGYDSYTGADVSPGGSIPLRANYETAVLNDVLLASLRRTNSNLPEDAIDQVIRLVTRPPEPTLAQNNRWFHQLITNGVAVEYRTPEGDTRGDVARLIDFDDLNNNEFLVVRQLTVVHGNVTRRADLVIYVNGLPLGVIELKDLSDESAGITQAYLQLQEYKHHIPALFTYNEVMAISDGDSTRVGSLTASSDRFAPWRSLEDSQMPGRSSLESLIHGLFAPHHLIDYLRFCITFQEDDRTGEIIKRIAGYHQFRAVLKGRDSVKQALRPLGDGRGGVVWHTQGSGKSLTMLMLSGALIADPLLKNPTLVVVTDRNDLDGQLFDTFVAGRALLRQEPEQADSRVDLAAKLDRISGGVVFTTMQKFEERGIAINDRSNVVVLADEAHRSQYGFVAGGARWMRDALPNATFVGFTGTPLERSDRNTRAVFGEDIDDYDIRQSIEDKATVPIYYEMRLIKLLPDETGIAEAQRFLDVISESDNEGVKAPSEIDIPFRDLVGARERLKIVAREIVDHFEQRREVIEGKGMAVCMTRNIAMDLYDEIVALRPDWHAKDDEEGFLKVVMTGSASEGDRVFQHSRTKARRERLASRFVDPESNLRLVIVCDMWLTGFDCPPMHTMYLDKPLAGHNLMQAIARVNRVFGEKPGGVVVDFLGIADQLRDAVQEYTSAGGRGKAVESIQAEAIPLMQRNYEALRDFFSGLDYNGFVGGSAEEQLQSILLGVDHVLSKEDGRRRFMTMVAALSQAFALSVPSLETQEVRDSLAYWQAVRAAIRKRLSTSIVPTVSDTQTAVRQVISGAIVSDGVIDLFQAVGLTEQSVGILSDEFLERIAALPERNLAYETLRKLLNDQITSRERINIVQSQEFRDALEAVLRRYMNRAITTAQVIDELIGLARVIREKVEIGEESGLTQEELAFYDALADNESAREVMQDETLVLIARELSDRIRSKATLDWTQRESVRADMRRTVRRLLARYGYPPDAQERATQLIIRQAELTANSVAGA